VKKKSKLGPKHRNNLTEAEKEGKEKLLKGIPSDLLISRFKAKVCVRCGTKGHGQYKCLGPKPVMSATTL
jgi:hypothetical protein